MYQMAGKAAFTQRMPRSAMVCRPCSAAEPDGSGGWIVSGAKVWTSGAALAGSRLSEMTNGDNREVIAADYAFTFLNQFANVALSALMKQHLLNLEQQKAANRQREDVHKFLGRLQLEQSNMYKKVVSVSTVATDLERLERNLRSNMSTHVLDMLGHSHRGIQ